MLESELIPYDDGPEGPCPVGLFAPCLSCCVHGADRVIIKFFCINNTIHVGSAIGDPVAGISRQEEGNANLDGGGVGGVLRESWVHGGLVELKLL